jgi:hypothetical protein
MKSIINLVPVYLLYTDGSENKNMKNEGFIHKIKIRYSQELFHNFYELFQTFNIDLNFWSKPSRNEDSELVQLYQFNKIMDFDNTYSFYERCGLFTLFTNSIESRDRLSEFLYDEIKQIYPDSTKQITKKTVSISSNISKMSYKNNVYTGDNGVDIKYKINILSLGRYTDKLVTTHKILTEMKIHHYLFCEDKEYELYNNWINNQYCVLINSGENFSELNEGGQHMRNYIIDYWVQRGEQYIWMLDDNIQHYHRLWRGNKIKIKSKEIFTSIEHFISHYQNIGMCSHNFSSFITSNSKRTCIVKNGKHFSSFLLNIQTGIKFRFKYNEDHIMSIDNLCSGYQTICFNHILYNKKTSGTQKGGNSNIYSSQGNQDGYNKKCFETIDFIRLQMGIGSMNMKDFNKIFHIQKKKKKGVEISHLQIKYEYIESDDNLQQIQEMTEFNSGLVLE